MNKFSHSRRNFLGASALSGLALTGVGAKRARAAQQGTAKQPHILFILVDDMGYADLSCYGAQGYRTPVLDELASQGMRFDQAYANAPICSPTRTGLLTGRYQGRYRAGLAEPNVFFRPGDELPLETPTVASMLREQGYRTAFVGKWHVCKVPEFSPLRYGYDSFFGVTGGAADYFRHFDFDMSEKPSSGLHDGDTPVRREGYLTDIFADEAIRQISQGGDKPLFLSLHFTAPHWPWEGPEDRAHALALKDLRDPTGGSLETYAQMMVNMDANVGRVLAALEEQGMTEDTLVVFTSDNGAERYSNSWPMVGYKGEVLEGGIRVPMIFRWPGRIAAGSACGQVAISMDTVPTFLAAAGGPIGKDLEGINLLPQLTGAAPEVERELFWRFNASEQAAVRSGDWKYLRIAGQEHLFDVRKDPRERADQASLQPEKLDELKAKWESWNASMLPYPVKVAPANQFASYADRYPEMHLADPGA